MGWRLVGASGSCARERSERPGWCRKGGALVLMNIHSESHLYQACSLPFSPCAVQHSLLVQTKGGNFAATSGSTLTHCGELSLGFLNFTCGFKCLKLQQEIAFPFLMKEYHPILQICEVEENACSQNIQMIHASPLFSPLSQSLVKFPIIL